MKHLTDSEIAKEILIALIAKQGILCEPMKHNAERSLSEAKVAADMYQIIYKAVAAWDKDS